MPIYGQVSPGFPTGNKNFIVNGMMNVWQRGTSLAYNTGGAFFGPADRFWFYNNTGATSGTLDRSTDVPSGQGFTYSLYNNTNGAFASGTNVELYRQGDYAPFKSGQTYTLSMWIKGTSSSTMTMNICWRNSHANGTNSVTIDNSKSFPITTSWNRVSATFTATANIDSNNMVLDFEWQMPSGCKITGVQLEEGPIATNFEFEPVANTVNKCQRYYYSSLNGDQSKVGWHGIGTGNYVIFTMSNRFPVTMRAAPTVTLYAYGYQASRQDVGDGRTPSGTTAGFMQYVPAGDGGTGNPVYPTATYGSGVTSSVNSFTVSLGENTTNRGLYFGGYTANAEL